MATRPSHQLGPVDLQATASREIFNNLEDQANALDSLPPRSPVDAEMILTWQV
jgi:hypothetical protein